MRKRIALLSGRILGLLAVVALSGAGARAAGKAEVIHSFGDGDGEYPASDLVMDGAGNIYGTTTEGGDFGSGTVFKLAPSGDGWTESVLYSFTSGADGAQPYNGVTLDAQGDLYGTAVTGGTGMACEGGCGVVYKLTNSGGTWTQSVLYNFTGGNDGSGPGAGLTFDASGNLYGMTPTGGEFGLGVIYQLKPGPNDTWQFNLVHTFTGGIDGATGSAGRMLLDGGNLYGAATVGGAHGKGTVFKLTPGPNGIWKLRTIYAFKGTPDAAFPYGALIRDAAGNLYGTTYYEGRYGYGAVYRLAPGPGSEWKERVIYNFKNGPDGGHPISHLNFDANGALYGTASEGGAPGCSCGTIFKLARAGEGEWQQSVPHAFRGAPDGKYPYNGMVAGAAGTFYGSTVLGGADDDGVVYEFKP
jgi:uncharacterized repeat protein (TIGR03803 family)